MKNSNEIISNQTYGNNFPCNDVHPEIEKRVKNCVVSKTFLLNILKRNKKNKNSKK